jgi:hypothetical protein
VSYGHIVPGNYDLFPFISKHCVRLMLSCIAFNYYVHERYIVTESKGSQYFQLQQQQQQQQQQNASY